MLVFMSQRLYYLSVPVFLSLKPPAELLIHAFESVLHLTNHLSKRGLYHRSYLPVHGLCELFNHRFLNKVFDLDLTLFDLFLFLV